MISGYVGWCCGQAPWSCLPVLPVHAISGCTSRDSTLYYHSGSCCGDGGDCNSLTITGCQVSNAMLAAAAPAVLHHSGILVSAHASSLHMSRPCTA